MVEKEYKIHGQRHQQDLDDGIAEAAEKLAEKPVSLGTGELIGTVQAAGLLCLGIGEALAKVHAQSSFSSVLLHYIRKRWTI